jgi:site-specific DNA-methyltransferase (adenine-specific)
VSKNQIIFGANHFISKIPFDSSCWIVWDKDNGATDFADCELAWTSFKTAVRMYSFKWNGMLQEDMKNKEIRNHPTQKPVKLYEWLLMKYAKQGDKILNTHLGSGSIAIACHEEKFDLVACEKDTKYYNEAIQRLKLEQMQTSLF